MMSNSEFKHALLVLLTRAKQSAEPELALWQLIHDAEALLEDRPISRPGHEIVAAVEREMGWGS